MPDTPPSPQATPPATPLDAQGLILRGIEAVESLRARMTALEKASDVHAADLDGIKLSLRHVEELLQRIAAADEKRVAIAERQEERRADLVGGLLKSSHVQILFLAIILAVLQALGMRIALSDLLPIGNVTQGAPR